MARERSRLLGAARGKFGYLLVALIVFLATAPVISEGPGWKLVLAGFGSGLLVAGLHAARPGRRSLILGLIVAAVEFGIGRMADVYESRWLLFAQALLWLLAMTYVTVQILEWVLGSAEVTLETLQAAFCAYLLLGLVWAFLYALMEVAAPASFRLQQGPPGAPSRRLIFIRLFIFSYATLTGTGFGDVSPSSPFAEIVACLEAMTAQVYLAVIIARLVGMQVGPTPPSRVDAALDEPESGRDRPD